MSVWTSGLKPYRNGHNQQWDSFLDFLTDLDSSTIKPFQVTLVDNSIFEKMEDRFKWGDHSVLRVYYKTLNL